MDKFDKFIGALRESLEAYPSSDPSIALKKAIDATKDKDGTSDGANAEEIELFVGAECVTRGGSRVTIVANDGVDCNKDFKSYPYKTIGEDGVPKSYCANGKYITGDSSPLAIDIVRILNPQDRPSPVKYREVNQFDIDKEVETLFYGKWMRSKLVSFFKSPPPGADPDELIETYSLEGPLPIDITTAEWWLSGPDEVRIIAKDNDPVVKTMWINVYGNGNEFIHPSAAMANLNGGTARRSCVKVEYIDGQYDA